MSLSRPFARPIWGPDAQKLFGTWRLVETTSDGKLRPERGAHPLGLITYHETGWMSAQIQPDRPPVAMSGLQPTGEEAVASLFGYTAYFGYFTLDEEKNYVTHHRLASIRHAIMFLWRETKCSQDAVVRPFRFCVHSSEAMNRNFGENLATLH